MQTIADLLVTDDVDTPLFVAAERPGPMTAAEAVTSAWQMGNILRHYGLRPGDRVAVVSGPVQPDADDEPGHLGTSPVPILAVLGALVGGGLVDLDPPAAVESTVLVAPTAWIDDYSLGPGTKPIGYGATPDDPTVAHLEREAWSENPTAPPVDLGPMDPAVAARRTRSHGDLMQASHGVVVDNELRAEDVVALRTPVTDAGAVVAGLLAPMREGATVLLDPGHEQVGTVAVAPASASVEEDRRIDPADAIR